MKQLTPLILLLFLGLFSSCEKDDICPGSTPTTPQLIIRFYDIADADQTKTVTGLFAEVVNDDASVTPILNESVLSRDSLVLPLRTDQDVTRFRLYTEYEIDNDGNVLGNPDEVIVTYAREDVYVSRACGFKTVFNALVFQRETDLDNWIVNTTVVTDSIVNENSAHVQVFH